MRNTVQNQIVTVAKVTSFAAALSGCMIGQWPPHRGGGIAEVAPPERQWSVNAPRSQSEQDLLSHVQRLEGALVIAIEKGADTTASANTILAQRLANRVRREIAGALFTDAAQDLIVLERLITEIEASLAPEAEDNA
jgi:hypothetical protein